MKPKGTAHYGVGYILTDCILLLDAIIDICTGETTIKEILALAILSVLTVCLFFAWLKRRR